MRIYVYLALAVVVIGAAKLAYSAIYNSGWNAAIVQQEQLIREAEKAAIDAARLEWENTALIATDNIVVEERIVEVIREIEKEIPITVERIVTVTPECSDLGSDFARLLNAQVNSGADRSNDRPDTSAEPDR